MGCLWATESYTNWVHYPPCMREQHRCPKRSSPMRNIKRKGNSETMKTRLFAASRTVFQLPATATCLQLHIPDSKNRKATPCWHKAYDLQILTSQGAAGPLSLFDPYSSFDARRPPGAPAPVATGHHTSKPSAAQDGRPLTKGR